MALECLGSFKEFCRDPHHLWVFDDGSLEAGDIERLREGLGEFRYVPRQEADDRTSTPLRGLPHLRSYRLQGALAYKLTDIPFFFPEGFTFVDSDILFTRSFKGVVKRLDCSFSNRFMEDEDDDYSIPAYRRGWASPRGIRLVPRINSGLFDVTKDFYEPSFVDWFVKYVLAADYHPWFLEQTTYSALAARASSAYFDQRQVRLPCHARLGYVPVAIHFMTTYRHLLFDRHYRAMLAGIHETTTDSIERVRVSRCPSDSFSAAVLRAILKRYRRRFRYPGSPPRV